MQLKKINIKAALVGTVALSSLSVIAPEIAYGARCQTGTPTNIRIESPVPEFNINVVEAIFNIRPPAKGSINNDGLYEYDRGIGCFQGLQPTRTNLNYRPSYLDLELSNYSNGINDPIAQQFTRLGFSSYEGLFYTYSFEVSSFPDNNISYTTFIDFYVPSQFRYRNSPVITLSNPDLNPFTTLKGLVSILSQAQSYGFAQITFPSTVFVSVIPPLTVPETSSTSSLIVLEMVGILIFLKRKN